MTDQELRDGVIAALDWEPGIDASNIGVTVKSGVVTLSGHVPTYYQRHTAERVAKRVKGVKGFVQNVEVRPVGGKEIHDDEIAVKAVSSLRWNVNVPQDAIQIEVNNGWVELTGEVLWGYERDAAEAAVRSLPGIRGISNLIMIKARPTVANLKERIEEALKRDAELQARVISVEVTGGRVTLKGKVGDWHEKQVLEKAVWAAPGVSAVDDQVVVQ